MIPEKTYLGDGVYCGFDGFHVVLSTDSGRGEQSIYLEPAVLDALGEYIDALKKALAEAQEGGA